MNYPQWPQELQQLPLVDGFNYSGKAPIKRQEMETGLDRTTRLSSTTVRTNSYAIICDESQAAVFWDFYEKEANAGADKVLMPMVTANKVHMHLCKFVGYPSVVPDGLEWRISFTLETDEQHINWS